MTRKCSAFDWCVAVPAEDSTVCALHTKYPDLCPMELDDEEREALSQTIIVDGKAASVSVVTCDACSGSGDCAECDGDGEATCECSECGDVHHTDCGECDGTGECASCEGSGRTGETSSVRPDAIPADFWLWTAAYREEWTQAHPEAQRVVGFTKSTRKYGRK